MRSRLVSAVLVLCMGLALWLVHRESRGGHALAALGALDTFMAADSRVDRAVLHLLHDRTTSFDDVQGALARSTAAMESLAAATRTEPRLAGPLAEVRERAARKEDGVNRFLGEVTTLAAAPPGDADAAYADARRVLDAVLAEPVAPAVATLRAAVENAGRRAAVRGRWLAILAIVAVGTLASAVQTLVGRLESSRDQERRANDRLEGQVAARTAELTEANRRLVDDIERRTKAERDRDRMEVELRHAQKLEAVGRLAAGIAHEINTPAQYVSDNTRFVKDAFTDVLAALREARAAAEADDAAAREAAAAGVKARLGSADFTYLESEVPLALDQCLDGLDRISTIVRAMKEFSHPGQEQSLVDLNRAIETAITVARNEWKYVADIVTDFAPDLPRIPCVPGELNQVVLNILVNAAHAIADVVGPGGERKGTITVGTRLDGDHVVIRIADTGTGMTEEVRARVFDPFFTTKDVGRGTGQGLAIAHSVIHDKHGGAIEVDSTPGAGTEFRVRLPLGGAIPASSPAPAAAEA